MRGPARDIAGRLRPRANPRPMVAVRSVAIVLSALLAAELAIVATAPPASAQTANLGMYTAVTPSRLHDVFVAPFTSVDLQVTGGTSGVPSDALAVVMDLTVIPGSEGWGVVWEQGTARPDPAVSINYTANQAVTNLVVARPSSSGKVSYYSHANPGADARVVVDVVGYYKVSSSGAGYAPVVQSRVYDSRPTPRPAGSVLDLRLRGVGGVPDDSRVTSVTVNVTVLDAAGAGFATVYERGIARPGWRA